MRRDRRDVSVSVSVSVVRRRDASRRRGEWIGTGTARVCDPCNVVIRWSAPLQVVTTTTEDEGAA